MFHTLDENTPVLIQGITGRMGRFHTALMREYGTNIVAGVSDRGDTAVQDGVPVYASCKHAVQAHQVVASVVMVPPSKVLPAVQEAVSAGVQLIVTIAEGIPVHDALRISRVVKQAGATWLGPSTPGLVVPGRIKLGFLPDVAIAKGPLAVMSKSGTLSYEVCYRLRAAGVGQSAWIGVGGDPVKGTRFADLAAPLAAIPDTRGLLLIGEVGGDEEESFAERLSEVALRIPVFALIAGREAKEGVSMGHAGALVMGNKGSLASKTRALEAAGVHVYRSIGELTKSVPGLLGAETAPVARLSSAESQE